MNVAAGAIGGNPDLFYSLSFLFSLGQNARSLPRFYYPLRAIRSVLSATCRLSLSPSPLSSLLSRVVPYPDTALSENQDRGGKSTEFGVGREK